MTVVVPMAGRARRFADAGVRVPKPLIDVRGRPMYAWAVDSLPLRLARRIVFVCLREHLEGWALEPDIRARYRALDPVIVPLDGVTEGQVCTVLAARALIPRDAPLLVYNADTYCRTNLARVLPTLGSEVAGMIGVFRAPGEQWSFARVDACGRVVETSEKRRISDWATTGLYWFARGGDFVAHADAMIAANERAGGGEFYVAPVYNRLIAAGLQVRVDEAREVWALGTPEDLARFEREFPG